MFHSYNTHIEDSLHVDLFPSSMGQRSIKYKGSSTIWNTVPEEMKPVTSTVWFVNITQNPSVIMYKLYDCLN